MTMTVRPLHPLCAQLAALGLMACCLPAALAQTSAPTPDAAASAPDAAPAPRQAALESVTITATRRAERLQDVPLSVSAVTGTAMEKAGVKSLADIANATSGVTVGASPQDSGVRVRGVGTLGGFSSASEQPVGVVIDGVVMGLGPVLDSLVDIERVEVLKGPQGTQFGKNASSGAVSITTTRPTMDRVKGQASVSYAELNERDVNAAVNVPLGEKAAVRVSAYDKAHDGYVQNVTRNEKWGGKHQAGLRAKLLIKPSEDLEVLAAIDASESHRKEPTQLWTVRSAGSNTAAEYAAAGVTPGNDNTQTTENARSFVNTYANGGSLEVNWRPGGDYTLTSVTAHRSWEEHRRFGLDTRSASVAEGGTIERKRQASQELRLTSPKGGAVEYVTGLYLYELRSRNNDAAWANISQAFGAPVPAFLYTSLSAGVNHVTTVTRSTAVFADGKLKLSDTLKLLGGLRYTRDRVTASRYTDDDAEMNDMLGAAPGVLVPPTYGALQSLSTSAGKGSGRIGLEYKPERDLLFYGTVATGYLGPTATFSALSGTASQVKPQTVKDVTLGMKSQFLDRKLTLNTSVFYDKYKNLQIGVFRQSQNEFITENAGGMRSKGFEFDTQAVLSSSLRGRASLTYADAKFTEYETACPSTGDTSRCNGSLYQAAGDVVPGAPKITSVLGLDHTLFLDSGWSLDSTATYAWRSKTYFGVGETGYVQGSYGVLNAGLRLSPEAGSWSVSLWARNLLDKHYQAAVLGQPFANGNGQILNWNARDARRTVGVTLNTKF